MLHVFRPCLIGRLACTSKMLRFHVQSRKNVGVVSTLFQAPQVGACNYFPALHARKRNSEPEPLLKPTIIKEVSEDDEDDDNVILDDFKEDEVSMNDEGDDYYEEDSVELYAGDGGGGGGISLAGVWWDNKALEIAEEVILSFDGDPKIYAFKTLPNFTIQVRIEKLLNRSGPQIWKTLKLFQEPIEHDLMKQKSVPENLSLEEMGRCWFSGVLIGLGCVWWVVVGVVEGYPAEDLVVRLPGQPNVGFKQYAGYVDVDVKAGRSLFYYFVEADREPDKKPLTLWLNGGPGCSSIGGGAFTELGPFYPTGDGRGLRRNLMSWNRASNLLFVESPAGVGWSYSNTSSDYNSGDASTARDMHTFLLKWYEKFPAFRSRELFLTGESYAGHYIPQLAIAILDHNEHSTGFKFNLKGIAIGNPLLRLDRDIPATYEYFWSHGMISDEIGLTIMNECDFDDYVFANPHNVTVKCNTAVSQVNQIIGDYINNYDVILDVCYPSIVQQELRLRKMATKISLGVDVCMSSERHFYFNLPEVQKALHANRTNLPYSWSMCSNVLNYSDTDGNINILPLLARIVHNRIPVWVFSGDQDSVVPLLGSRTLIRELAHDLKFQITVPYGAWFHKGQVGGWATEYGDLLTFATVRGAAHMVPYAQPSRALHLFSSFIRGRRLPNTTHPSISD